MPLGTGTTEEPAIYRRLEARVGIIDWRMRCFPRFRYGAESAQAERAGDALRFRGLQPGDVALLVARAKDERGSRPPELGLEREGASAVAHGRLLPGESVSFGWLWGRSGKISKIPDPEPSAALWAELGHRCPADGPCPFAGPWHDLVARSALLTRLLMPHYSGSLAESVTTSLPALRGGSRNWDHRYAWLRSIPQAMQGLVGLGFEGQARELFQWLTDLVVRDRPEELQPVYTLDGGRYLPEQELASLSGYQGSRPVRIGNLSARQFQLDTSGHVLLASWLAEELWKDLPPGLWERLAELTDSASMAWRKPDWGIWEVRAKPQHFLSSKLHSWACLDRACFLAQRLGRSVPQRWLRERAILHRTICEQGYDAQRGSFVRAFGERELDASALLLPILGFLPFDDERVTLTLAATQEELGEGVLLRRGNPADGSLDSDGAHWLSSLWYVSCLALGGRADEASDRLAELCAYATPLGLLAEQVQPGSGLACGNFPSSSAHLTLVNAALHVSYASAKAKGKEAPATSLSAARLHPAQLNPARRRGVPEAGSR
jgi:GH15 family glucan-1,4-alpha-glucosidase